MTQVVGRPSPGDGIPEQIADAIRERTLLEPVAGVVLGSGLSEAVDEVRSVATDEGVELS